MQETTTGYIWMSLIQPNSCEGLHSGIYLFSVLPTQTTVIQGNPEDYLDLFNTILHLRAKITLVYHPTPPVKWPQSTVIFTV